MLGKRGMGQLAPFDFIIIIALGSAVGDPMFYPDVPVLHALVAITAIVLFTCALVRLTQKNRRLQDFLSARAERLVCDGVLDLKAMEREGVSRAELFQGLRAGGLEQLGQVERAYLEPSGRISSFLQPPEAARPGIPLLPGAEESRAGCWREGETAPAAGHYGCWRCGCVLELAAGAMFPACPACGEGRWTRAVRRVREILGGGSRPGR
jgi:hypothetical protein